jgi:hypothetical protein
MSAAAAGGEHWAAPACAVLAPAACWLPALPCAGDARAGGAASSLGCGCPTVVEDAGVFIGGGPGGLSLVGPHTCLLQAPAQGGGGRLGSQEGAAHLPPARLVHAPGGQRGACRECQGGIGATGACARWSTGCVPAGTPAPHWGCCAQLVASLPQVLHDGRTVASLIRRSNSSYAVLRCVVRCCCRCCWCPPVTGARRSATWSWHRSAAAGQLRRWHCQKPGEQGVGSSSSSGGSSQLGKGFQSITTGGDAAGGGAVEVQTKAGGLGRAGSVGCCCPDVLGLCHPACPPLCSQALRAAGHISQQHVDAFCDK